MVVVHHRGGILCWQTVSKVDRASTTNPELSRHFRFYTVVLVFLFTRQSGSLWSCSIASIGAEIGQLDTHLNCHCTRCGKTCQEEGVAITRGGIKVNCIIMEKCRVIKRRHMQCVKYITLRVPSMICLLPLLPLSTGK